MAVLPPLEKALLQSRESDADAEMSSSSLSEEDAWEYDMSEDLEDSLAVTSPPHSSKLEKADKYCRDFTKLFTFTKKKSISFTAFSQPSKGKGNSIC
ncbi:hypothetical protein AVEN_62337-1 [Araneus ventricosus]|uniref:Uncharacterized protein n=1 Tax=Araneus ventricosus TaxID=182803 RepID=A0A4Y2VSQ9_ARAVE|nr:hypothetical protein AVEN_32986-1 [Araneus ventricosus]GBO27731.1 hypothetical protein AVEN_62337-1 [Araneus ventricosus]